MRRTPSLAGQCLTRIICVFALLWLGFAHKPPSSNSYPIAPAELALHVLPDGSLPVLCLPSEDGKTKHDHTDMVPGCEVCRLTASVLLPQPADVFGTTMPHERETFVPVRAEAVHRQIVSPNTSPRGPPARLIA